MIANLLTWGVTKLIGMAYFWFQRISNHTALRQVPALYKWNNQSFSWRDLFRLGLPQGGIMSLAILLVSLLTAALVISRFILVYRSYHYAEHGAESFATAKEIKRTYKLVPDRVTEFAGVGGVPISHFNGLLGYILQFLVSHQRLPRPLSKFFWPGNQRLIRRIQTGYSAQRLTGTGQFAIDTDTNNTLAIGITRSGKGETFVLPTIDLLSRAAEKTSIIVNDPKGELSRLSTAMLKERGYRVLDLDLQNMANSAGYNPLSIITRYAQRENWSKVQMETNRLSTAIYAKENSNGNSAFWDNSSINLLNAIILAQIELAQRHDCWEKVTLHNVYEMMTDLAGQSEVNKQNEEVSLLTLYFNGLKELNALQEDQGSELRRLALDAFSQSKFAGDETAGSIYASMMEGIKIYQQRDLAQLTAESSFDIREAGFPRWLTVQFDKSLANQPVNVEFYEKKDGKCGSLIEKRQQQLDEVGWLDYPIKQTLPADFEIAIQLPADLKREAVLIAGEIKSGLGGKKTANLTTLTGKPLQTSLHYSEQPIALFLRTPPDNPSYNQIVSFFVDQSFNQFFGMATASGGKTFTRIYYLLDEFGNLPKIAHMDTKVSIGLGANILFSLIVQNLSQLRINYSDEQAQTIESNCANTVYILTKELKTAETISKSLGQTTINSFSHRSRDGFGAAQQDFGNSSDSGVNLLSAAELMHLKLGESIVLRTKRNSLAGADVRNNPIFNRDSMKMPQRWQFLGQTFYERSDSLQALTTSPALIDLQERGYDYNEELTAFVDPKSSLFDGQADWQSEDFQGLSLDQWEKLDQQQALNQIKQFIQTMDNENVDSQLINELKKLLEADPDQLQGFVAKHWQLLTA